MESKKNKKGSIIWRGLYFLTFFVSFGYVFLEWLFVVTKPSFLTNINWLLKVEILLFVSGASISLSLLVVSFFYLIYYLLKEKKFKHIVLNLAFLVPTMILASLILILIDNFTYTVLDYGIIKTNGVIRAIYGLFFIALIFFLRREIRAWCLILGRTILKFVAGWKIALGVLVVVLILILFPVIKTNINSSVSNEILSEVENKSLPNIIIITSDGLDADHMSVYGYERNTTPYLLEKVERSLFVENNFNNNARTSGSIISILTGKYPSTTRVVFSPDILRNDDAYQHLPGMLNAIGYHTAQFGGEAVNFNLLRGFDEINGSAAATSTVLDAMDDYIPGDFAFFTYEVLNRIIDRLRHIFFIKKMDDSLLHLTEWDGKFNDYENLNNLFALIENSDTPFFVQMHWLGTHGDYFKVRNQVFSKGKDPNNQEAWDQDFYDDAILEFDDILRGIEEKLEDFDKLKNTIIVVGSDHGQYWSANKRIPLIMMFPDGSYAQRIVLNGQNLDIAPTLLNYIGIEKPIWMQGDSLLDGINNQRLIFSFDLGSSIEGELGVENDPEYSVPPFYQFGRINIIDCDQFYTLDLRNGFHFEKQKISNYETSCNYIVQTDQEVLNIMRDHLKKNKFDISGLEIWMEEITSQ